MDKELLVDLQIDDGHQLLVQLFRDGFEVSVALWLKKSEANHWSFYITSSSIREEKIGEAYQPIFASLRKIPDCSISLSDINLISSTNPIAKEAIALRDRRSKRLSSRFTVHRFGDIPADEVYIYPRVEEPKPNALDTIYDEVIKLRVYLDENKPEKIREGLDRIASLARNQQDVPRELEGF